MKIAVRYLTLVLLVTLLAACAGKKPVTDDDGPVTAPPERPPVDTERLDPRDFTDPRNLDNPESLLSRRTIYFEFDRSDVRPEFRPVLEAHAAYARANPSARVVLEGHCDERGSREYNLGLGERRGNSVDQLMSANGAPRGQLEVISYGEERPTCRASNEDCWQRNRRVEIVYTAR